MMTDAVPDLADFEGEWRLERVITQANGADGRFSGRAEWWPDGEGLTCRETGVLQLEGQAPLQGERRYLWRRGADGGIEILFGDGRPFHRIAPEFTPGDRHHCPPDTYDVRYVFHRWPVWSSTWTVRGPRKAYTMRSTYRRIDVRA